MATVLYNGAPLNKRQDWGDADGLGHPASGRYVQDFIKETLDKKFGYLFYDESSRQYIVFADEYDYNLWETNKTANASKILARFDAPAPATISVFDQSNGDVETLLTSTGRKISFRYFIKDSSNSPFYEGISIRATFDVSGMTYTGTKMPDSTWSSEPQLDVETGKWSGGTYVEIPIDNYLTRTGDYTIQVTITGMTSQVSTTLIYQHRVTQLDLEISNFNNANGYDIADDYWEVDAKMSGAAGSPKILDVFVDGKKFQTIELGSQQEASNTIKLVNKKNGVQVTWRDILGDEAADEIVFTAGKHSVQFRGYISSKSGEAFYTNTKYYDFIVYDTSEDKTYIVYLTEIQPREPRELTAEEKLLPAEEQAALIAKLTAEANLFDPEQDLTFTVSQYTSSIFRFAAFNTKGRSVELKAEFVKPAEGEETEDLVESISLTVDSGKEFEIDHQFQTAGEYAFTIYEYNDSRSGDVEFEATVNVTSIQLEDEDIKESLPQFLIARYSALNRTNNVSDRDIWVNTAENAPEGSNAILHNVAFKTGQSGWENHSLVLSNGAYIEIPINLFDYYRNNFGLTFEIDFETFNSQDDDAILMNYADSNSANSSYIKIRSCKAEMQSQQGVYLNTNYKDGSRVKVAFVFNPIRKAEDINENSNENPNLMMIYVNGVLDRTINWGDGSFADGDPSADKVTWTNPTVNSLVIGNKDGEAAIKIYSIRIYRTALLPEEEFMNFAIDQGSNIPEIMARNHVLKGGKVDLEYTKAMISTMVLYTDYDQLRSRANKKDNTRYNLQYFDHSDPELNFFVRNGWMSLQGTSSMQYPTKNLRPYFNKVRDKKRTFEYAISTSDSANTTEARAALGAEALTANFNTEFWPVSEYRGHETNVESYLDDNGILPYLVNKKEVIAISKEEAYHEIGMKMSDSYKSTMAKKYLANGEPIFYSQVNGDVTDYVLLTDTIEYDSENNEVVTPAANRIDNLIKSGSKLYISAYRPLRRTKMTDEQYETYLKELRYSGVKLYTRKAEKNENGDVVKYIYKDVLKDQKKKVGTADEYSLDPKVDYYCLGAYWRQYNEKGHVSGWTDRWTLKADYAESSNTHNGGIGSLWGWVLKSLVVDQVQVGRTNAQNKVNDVIDIRTSCDCKPIVLFVCKPTGYARIPDRGIETYNGGEEGYFDGHISWSEAEFVGLFNIMTDKSSTPLFGFEDIYNEKGERIFKAGRTQCWEFLQNGSTIATGVSVGFDGAKTVTRDKATQDEYGYNTGEGRQLFEDFEPRWPEAGSIWRKDDPEFYQDDVFGVESYNFETFWNWLWFTKPAVVYTVDGQDGYKVSQYIPFDSYAEALAWKKQSPATNTLYIKWNNSGNDAWSAEGTMYRTGETYQDPVSMLMVYEELPFDWLSDEPSDDSINKDDVSTWPAGWTLCYKAPSIDWENVKKSVRTETIHQYDGDTDKRGGWGTNGHVYKVKVNGFDSNNRFIGEDGVLTNDAEDDQVTVYMWKDGAAYKYVNSNDEVTTYDRSLAALIDENSYLKAADGRSYADKTYMQFFEDTMGDHLDLYKVAAYYIYIIRFGAVDQCIKNCMFTTEDGEHWYFINYDNDTILGVRNDALLIFNWDFDRDTYDYSGNSYAYAGAKSVLWNNLTASSVFMEIVKTVDSVMYNNNLLSEKMVLEYLDERHCKTWPERLYNIQEENKYLATFREDLNQTKFLQFLQGTRMSHRDWWVHHRWELYDSIWGTGSYSQKLIHFYLIITTASNSNPVTFMRISAASKYTFGVESNNRTKYTGTVDDWSRTLNAAPKENSSASFLTYGGIAIGDPMTFIGPQKLKVLNFRPGAEYLAATLQLTDQYTKVGSTTKTNWVEEAGTMMTKLLIGNGNVNVPLTMISGLPNVTSIEELDLRRCTLLKSSPAINNLNNLHIYRADGAAANIFNPAVGATFYEVSLPKGTAATGDSVIVTDDEGNPIQDVDASGAPLFDGEGNPVWKTEYITAKTYVEQIGLDNVTFTTDPLEYPVYQKDNNGNYIENGDQLPYGYDNDGKLTGIYAGKDEDVFRYTSESGAIFDYKPTRILNTVRLNNVTGFDTEKFVMDWIDVLKDNSAVLDNYTLNLQNINWTHGIKVSDLIEFVFGMDKNDEPSPYGKFNFKDTTGTTRLTGTITVISDDSTDDEQVALSIDEFNRLTSDEYFGPNAFLSAGYNGLRLATTSGIFYQATGRDVKEYADVPNFLQAYKNAGAKIYEVVRGKDFNATATIFPDDGYEHVYTLIRFSGNNLNPNLVCALDANASDPNTFTDPNNGVTVRTTSNGAIVNAKENTIYGAANNLFFGLLVTKRVDDKLMSLRTDPEHEIELGAENTQDIRYSADKNPYIIYFKVVDKVIPASADNILTYIDNNVNASRIINIVDGNKEYKVVAELPEATNANYTLTVTNPNSEIFTISEPVINGNRAEFTVKAKIQRDSVSGTINLNYRFDSEISSKRDRQVKLTVNVNTVKLNNIRIIAIDADGNKLGTGEYTNNAEITYPTPGKYYYRVIFDEGYNVAVKSRKLSVTPKAGVLDAAVFTINSINDDFDNNIGAQLYYSNITADNEFIVDIKNNIEGNNYTDLFGTLQFNIEYTDEFDNKLNIATDHTLNLVYPVDVHIKYNIRSNAYISDDNNNVVIALLNNQGTDNGLNGTYDYIEFTPTVDDKEIGDVIVTPEHFVTHRISIDANVTTSHDNPNIIPMPAVTFETVNDNQSFRLHIPAKDNIFDNVTITGKYIVKFDSDNDQELTVSDKSIEKNFSVTVKYAAVDANNKKDLTPRVFYLVDINGNFYRIPEGDLQAEGALSNTPLATAMMNGVNFVGFGMNTGTTQNPVYKFLYLAKGVDEELLICNAGQMFNPGYTSAINSLPGNTTITIEQLLNTIQSANSENYMRSNIYKIYHSLDNTGFKIVLPSSGDLTTIFGINNNYSGTPVESTWLKTYEAIVETLNNANYNYMSMTRYLTEYLNSVDLAGYNIPSYHPCTTEPTDNILFFFIYNTTWNTDSLYCYTVEYLNDNTYNITAAWNANGTGSWFKAIGSASTKLFGEMQNLTGPDNAVNRWRFANTRFLPFLEIK